MSGEVRLRFSTAVKKDCRDREASGSEGPDTSQDLTSLSGFSGTPVISVSDALTALREVSTEGAVQFLPGTIHRGKNFSCCFVR